MNELGNRILERFLLAQDPEAVDEWLRDTRRSHRESLEHLRTRAAG